jgi:hypothetical protein
VWSDITESACVLLECPSRWYLGVVESRTALTVRLKDAVCGHDLGDLGLFLEGKVSSSTELTPLPRTIEINLGSVDSAQAYPAPYLAAIRKRTHTPEGQRNA